MLRLSANGTYLYAGKRLIPLNPDAGVIPKGVRSVRIGDKTYLSVRDIIKTILRKGINAAGKVWRDLPAEKKKELADCLYVYRFPGFYQKKQPVVTLEGALKLIMWLPGDAAKSVHGRVAAILARHFQDNTDQFTKWLLDTGDQVQAEIDAREPAPKYVYCAESASFPGLVKIGYAADLSTRMVQANVFNAPVPFHVAAHVSSMDARRDEKIAHVFFAQHREEGEFFRVTPAAVQDFFNQVLLPMYHRELSLTVH